MLTSKGAKLSYVNSEKNYCTDSVKPVVIRTCWQRGMNQQYRLTNTPMPDPRRPLRSNLSDCLCPIQTHKWVYMTHAARSVLALVHPAHNQCKMSVTDCLRVCICVSQLLPMWSGKIGDTYMHLLSARFAAGTVAEVAANCGHLLNGRKGVLCNSERFVT